MTTITNYNTLVQNIVDTAEDDGTEFSAYIPTSIDLAEERMFRELDLIDLEVKETGSMVEGNPYLTKPDGYEYENYLNITVSGKKVMLRKRMDDYILDYWPDQTVEGTPKYYGENSLTTFIVAPTPDQSYVYELKMTRKPAKLSVTNQTNYYVDEAKDILFFASMVEQAKFMKAWSQVQFWEAEYVKTRDAWNIEAGRKRRDNGEVPNNPDGGPNSLKHTIRSNA